MSFLRRISITLLIASSLILGCVSTACNSNEPSIEINQSDEVAIYSAVIRQIYFAGHTFGDAPVLYIIQYTDDTASDPKASPSEPILISESVQSEIKTTLDDLPTEIIWVNSSDEVSKDSWGTVLDDGVIITLGNINLQGDNSVQVPCRNYMAMDGGGGRTYVLRRIEGIWHITGTTGTSWIS
jgi:hypothetical protein